MPFSTIGKFLRRNAGSKLAGQAAVALAIEAGAAFVSSADPALSRRVRLVSIKDGKLHALATSAPAKEELLALKEPLFSAMKKAAPVRLEEFLVELRGTLAEEGQF